MKITEHGKEFVKTGEFAEALRGVMTTACRDGKSQEATEAWAFEFIMLILTDRLDDVNNPPTREETGAFLREHWDYMNGIFSDACQTLMCMDSSASGLVN
jgi:hypothetical protein